MYIFGSIASILFGLAFGSFLNAALYRTARKKTLWGRSFCPFCKTNIQLRDLIPVASFFFLLGKCRSCKKNISWQYPAVEALTSLLFFLSFIRVVGNDPTTTAFFQLILFWFVVVVLIFLAVYDIKYYLILDVVSLPAIVVVFLGQTLLFPDLRSVLTFVVAAVAGAGFFCLQFVLSRGKWVGGGDIRLGALMGAILGWPLLLVALFLAYVGGSVVLLPLLLGGKKRWKSEVPFGPFLACATFVTMLYGDTMLRSYLAHF